MFLPRDYLSYEKMLLATFLGFLNIFLYLCLLSEASLRYAIAGGNLHRDWQSLPWAEQKTDSNAGLLHCIRIRSHWPPLLLEKYYQYTQFTLLSKQYTLESLHLWYGNSGLGKPELRTTSGVVRIFPLPIVVVCVTQFGNNRTATVHVYIDNCSILCQGIPKVGLIQNTRTEYIIIKKTKYAYSNVCPQCPLGGEGGEVHIWCWLAPSFSRHSVHLRFLNSYEAADRKEGVYIFNLFINS